jgi:prolyl 3-hydroxylase /prolyl 3,4-dihydroxylase
MLQDWINPEYLKRKEMMEVPFPHAVFSNFFVEEKMIKVLKALTKEKFFLKEADLFTFRQTHDFVNTSNTVLKEFYDFISSSEFIEFMSSLTNKKLSNHIDMFSTLYEDTDFLLCHDDKLEGRKIAYFLYLSSCEGGQLSLFSQDGVTTIKPSFNTFSFFEVSDKSLHQVEEVLSGQRITITGWFHGQ